MRMDGACGYPRIRFITCASNSSFGLHLSRPRIVLDDYLAQESLSVNARNLRTARHV